MLGSARVKAKADCRNPPLFHSLLYFLRHTFSLNLELAVWVRLTGQQPLYAVPLHPGILPLLHSSISTEVTGRCCHALVWYRCWDLNSGPDACTARAFQLYLGHCHIKHISSLVKLHGGNQPDTLNTLLSRKKMFLGTINETHTIKHHAVCFAWGLEDEDVSPGVTEVYIPNSTFQE